MAWRQFGVILRALIVLALPGMHRDPHSPLADLIKLLDLEEIDSNLFRGFHPADQRSRLFGGQIMAQALIAAGRTVDAARRPHALHGYFLLAGDPAVPAVFDVERIRDGTSFATRRVVVIQHGRAIFNMDVSFQIDEPGAEHQDAMPALAPPDEDRIPDHVRDSAFLNWRHNHRQLLEEAPQKPEQFVWFRANGPVADDPLLHAALLVYESDRNLLSAGRMPHRGSFRREHLQNASLDHAMWLHAPVRVDQWLLYAVRSNSASNARSFNEGSIFTSDGVLVASTAQEGLMRARPPAVVPADAKQPATS